MVALLLALALGVVVGRMAAGDTGMLAEVLVAALAQAQAQLPSELRQEHHVPLDLWATVELAQVPSRTRGECQE